MNPTARVSSLVSALVLALGANAADNVKLDIKSGFWEVSSAVGKVTGQPPIPEELLQKLSPEQQENFAQSMRAALTKPMTHKMCADVQSLSKSLFFQGQEGCKQQIVADTPSELGMAGSCARQEINQSYQVHIRRLSPEAYTGSFRLVLTGGTRTLTVETSFRARWLAASCGEEK